ncbi:TPA: AAA family ATPase [Pseudomonas aeruginosa]|nr:AAA family ATPase [Pseudomonas aeruginosa]
MNQRESSVGQPSCEMQDGMLPAQNGAGATLPPSQGGSGDDPAKMAPAAPQPERWGSLPAALRDRPQWVLAGADKRPLTAEGRAASSTDPNTWTDFDTACRAAAAKGLHIGYMLHESDPFACIDLDVKDETPQEHFERFQKIVAAFDSYTERSRSGKGLHVWVEGKIGRGVKRDGVEVYSQERFIICTGDTYIDRPVAQRQELLGKLASEMRPSASTEIQLDGDDAPDWSLAAFAAQDSGELGRLFAGDWQGRYPSQSEADLALVKLLLPHADSLRECWLTFRLSKLGERDKAGRLDYARATLSLATQHLANDAAQVQHGQQIAESLFWRDSTQRGNPRHFRLLSDRDLQRLPAQRWLVKGIIPQASVGTVFGQSGTFKSFLVLDLLAHIANGQPWFGHRVTAAPAVYVPFEGQGGIPRRVAAWRIARMHSGCSHADTNMRYITDRMNLRQQADRDKLVQTLTECGWAGGVLCIDTLAQAGAGIDENSSEGMGEMIAIFQELQHRLGGTVLVVHHEGKTASAGMRGWSGLRGALDFAIKCWRDDDWDKSDAQFVLDKVKDGEDGRTFNFSMLRVHIGMDEEGDEISSLTVIPPQEREQAPDDAALAAADDEFVDGWIRRLVEAGQRPTGRGLEGMRVEVKAEHDLTQKRLRDAIARLKDRGRLMEEKHGGPSGAKWLRPVDAPQVQRG